MDVDDLRQRLVAKAHLFGDPEAYTAGVNDAIATMTLLREWEDVLSGEVRDGDGAQNALVAASVSVRGAGAVEQATQPERAGGVA